MKHVTRQYSRADAAVEARDVIEAALVAAGNAHPSILAVAMVARAADDSTDSVARAVVLVAVVNCG